MVQEGESFPLITARQVHGEGIIDFSVGPEKVWDMEGDALITRERGFALGVFTADCLPVLLFDPENQAIGIVHAGWRGTANALAAKTVHRMQKTYASRPPGMIAVLGPCIGPCCYEVDGPVKSAFLRGGIPWESVASSGQNGLWRLDLRHANAYLLEKTGMNRANIHSVSECTCCQKGRFFSYRAEKETGRQVNFVALRRQSP